MTNPVGKTASALTAPLRAQLIAELRTLVAIDTRNPPRSAAAFVRLFDHVEHALMPLGFRASRRDLGDGCLWWHAVRGSAGHRAPLFNIHTDTVPAADGWAHSPHAMVDDDGVCAGLGTCDTKGALAALMIAAQLTDAPAEMVLTTDEEAGQSTCVRTFCRTVDVRDRLVVVSEPTRMLAVTAHRGIGTCTAVFAGTAGHGSLARALNDSANHEAVRWAARALDYASQHDVRLNLGLIEGGQKPNMISAEARVRFGVRPAPGQGTEDVLAALATLAERPQRATFTRGFVAPPLQNRSNGTIERLSLAPSPAVDFFTEAAFFQEAGADAFVLGPGDIVDAHTAHEHVRHEALDAAALSYAHIMNVCEGRSV